MTEATLPWPVSRDTWTLSEDTPGASVGDGRGDSAEGVIDSGVEGITGDRIRGVIDGVIGGVIGPADGGVIDGESDGVTGDDDVLPVGDWAVTDGAGNVPREVPAAVTAVLSWMGSAARSDILGGGPGGLIDRIRYPEPSRLRSHCGAIAGQPRTGNEYLAALLTGARFIATVPVKITGKTFQGIGAVGKRIDLAGDHPATIAVIAVTATAMILAVIFT